MTHALTLEGHILNILKTQTIREQVEFQEALKAKGHNVPQATLSRRLKKLKIAKVGGVYTTTDVVQHPLPLIVDLRISEFGLVVMHTQPGHAGSLAYFIDQKYVNPHEGAPSLNGLLGTIAGDDTVLLVLKSKAVMSETLTALYQDFPYLREKAETVRLLT